MAPEIALAVIDGRLAEAITILGEQDSRAAELRVALGLVGQLDRYWVQAYLWLGRGDEALARLEAPRRPLQAARAMCLAQTGQVEEARRILDWFDGITSDDDESSIGVLASLLRAATFAGDHQISQALLRRLAPLARLPIARLDGLGYARLLGDAAVLMGDRTQARAYYEQGLEACKRIGFRPETALTRLCLAELLLAGEPPAHEEALNHLDFAIDEFRAMGMQPALERALRLRADGIQENAPQTRASYPGGLSTREVEVLRLVASGKTNHHIAATLVISPNTVVRHLSNIFAKLGVSNRTEAANYASRHGLC
jgi:DNA-binding CsgD family transcriptional regulator